MGHRTGGVGAIAKAPHRLVEVKPVTPEFDELSATLGRAALYAVEFKGAKAAKRTSDMFEINFNELKMQPDGPKFIVGDGNATTADITSLKLCQHHVIESTWHDLGALVELWGAIAM